MDFSIHLIIEATCKIPSNNWTRKKLYQVCSKNRVNLIFLYKKRVPVNVILNKITNYYSPNTYTFLLIMKQRFEILVNTDICIYRLPTCYDFNMVCPKKVMLRFGSQCGSVSMHAFEGQTNRSLRKINTFIQGVNSHSQDWIGYHENGLLESTLQLPQFALLLLVLLPHDLLLIHHSLFSHVLSVCDAIHHILK